MNLTQVEAMRLTNALFDILMEEISSGVSVKISGIWKLLSQTQTAWFVPKKDRIPSGKTLKAYVEEKDGELRDSAPSENI